MECTLENEMPDKTATTTKHATMGAMPSAKGVTFRVWAPHAEKVFVTGTFNGWDKLATPLVSEGNGRWFAEVPGQKQETNISTCCTVPREPSPASILMPER